MSDRKLSKELLELVPDADADRLNITRFSLEYWADRAAALEAEVERLRAEVAVTVAPVAADAVTSCTVTTAPHPNCMLCGTDGPGGRP